MKYPGPPIPRFWSNVQKSEGCWEWIACRSPTGYGKVTIHRKNLRAHRFAWEVTYGPIPDGMLVLHRCDNPPCVRPDHLFLGTNRDNTHDMFQKGRNANQDGDRGPRAKLTPDQVVLIRERWCNGESQNSLAKEFGICQAQVWRIVHHWQWTGKEATDGVAPASQANLESSIDKQ